MWKGVCKAIIAVLTVNILAACGGGGGGTPPVAKDTQKPTVGYTTPTNQSTGIPINRAVTVTFSEPMDAATITAQAFTVSGIQGTVVYDTASKTATFTHQGLQPNTQYTVTIKGSMADLSGNAIGVDHSFNFTTSASTDVVPPSVTAWLPAAAAVPLNSAITAAFSEPVAVDTMTVMEQGTLTPVAGAFEYISGTATFKPTADLKPNTTYTATIGAGTADTAGNALNPVNASFTFTTGAARDEVAPTVVPGSLTPADGATNVPRDVSLSISFSEPIYPFVGAAIDGEPVAVEFDFAQNKVTIKPSNLLVAGYTYTSRVQVRDLAGNQMSAYVWSFTMAQ